MALVLDTGPIVALLDADDPAHTACSILISKSTENLVVTAPVLVEVDYWVQKLLGADAWNLFLEDLANGAYHLEDLTVADFTRAAEIERDYEALDLGLVDASVMALCERLGETKVSTLDKRDFSAVRPRHCDHLELLPS